MDAIVCFYADGSEKYTPMTAYALSSFLKNTPSVPAALFTHTPEVRDQVLKEVPEALRYRVGCHFVNPVPPLPGWNPTQHKLDIASLSTLGYNTIFWADSDVIVFGDMTPFIESFIKSNALVYVVPDHVMHDSVFQSRWREEHPDTIIPQACLMGFRSSIIAPLFEMWREIWQKWISPWPFARFRDPRPGFAGSAFCIEQYALGNALRQFFESRHRARKHSTPFRLTDYVMVFERETLIIDPHHGATLGSDPSRDHQEKSWLKRWPLDNGAAARTLGAGNEAGNHANLSLDISRLNLMSSLDLAGYGHYSGLVGGLYSGPAGFSGLNAEQFSGIMNFSGLSGFSGLVGYSGPTEYSGLTEFPGYSGLTEFSGYSGLLGYSGPAGSYSGLAYSGLSYSGLSLDTSAITYDSLGSVSFNVPSGVIIIDRFGLGPNSRPSIYHTYSQFYPTARAWFEREHKK